MLYIISQLITEKDDATYSLLGATADLGRAAAIAAAAYRAYNKDASGQNVAMITEWLSTRRKYSFRSDKDHRLQLAITELEGDTMPADQQVVFSESREQDELMRRMSQALFEGEHTAVRGEKSVSCPIDKA